MINVDNKVQTEIHKHGNMLPTSIREIIFGQSNCKTNVLISLPESPHTFRDRICVLEVVATAKIPILGEFISTD